jgi:NitT/TauT family transport system substrate-binding protein
VATKRAVRAFIKNADVCALEPERTARFLVEDTVRFYALRLHEAGLVKSSPQKLIAQGTDWRFFNELKKELKG